MPSFTYNLNIPATNNNPSVDQPNMLTNNNSINSILGVDHNSFNIANGGYHTVIHEVTQVADPAAIASVNQVYAKNYTPDSTVTATDTQLFARTGLGSVSQLTGRLATGLVGTDGWAWMGGMLIQWGTVSFSGGNAHETNTVTFQNRVSGAIPFPTQLYEVIATLRVASSSETIASNTIAVRNLSATSFEWVFNSSSATGSTKYPGFRWIAIGN